MIVKAISQKDLTSECWMVQFLGLGHCKNCEHRNTEECGGQKIRSSGKNQKEVEVPFLLKEVQE